MNSMSTTNAPRHDRHQDLAQNIIRAIEGSRFGSVEIVIHDSRVVQIERKEKLRFETDSSRTI